ncbi:MAG: transketolase family protein [Polyangiales bacterium]
MTYENYLAARAETDDALIVMTAENRAAIRNLPAKLGAKFIDVGIAEQTMIGAAAGLALRGRTPIVHALATFLTLRAYEFIRTDVGIAHLPVVLVGGVPGFLSDGNGPTHQAIEDVALMRGIPGMQVFCPADEAELLAGIPKILDSKKPTYVRYYAGKPVVEHGPFEIGKAEQLGDGKDVTLMVYGFLLKEVVEARAILEKKGLSVRILNVRMPKPIDEEAVLRAARETKMLVSIEDHFKTGGLYSIVAELLLGQRTTAHVLPIALEEKWFKPALLADVLKHERFTGPQIADRVLAAMG